MAAALLFRRYCDEVVGGPKLLSVIGSLMLICLPCVVTTVGFPLLDTPSIFFVVATFYAIFKRNIPAYLLAVAGAVATKEVLAGLGAVWFVNDTLRRGLSTKERMISASVALAPFVMFLGYRQIMGTPALVWVGTGLNPLAGQWGVKWKRILSDQGRSQMWIRLLATFTIWWIGVLKLKNHPFLLRSIVWFPIPIIAMLFFCGQVWRVMGIFAPIVIPGFLFYLKESTNIFGFEGGDSSSRSSKIPIPQLVQSGI